MIKNLLNIMWNSLAIRNILSIFDNEAHNIISDKGHQILKKKND